ncbi:DHA2 family efflux MFS transporter permease subunit [Amycolatopsis dongchuanensis]
MTGTKTVTKKAMLVAVLLATFMAMLDASVVTLALPSIGGSLAGLQWVLDGYVVALATVMLTGGALGDRYGRKKAFLAGLVVFTLASAGCALAPDTGWLVAARVLQGAGASVLVPGGLSLIAQAFPDPRERARMLGIGGLVGGLGFVVGPLLGGPLTDAFGWRSIFLLNLPLGVVALVAGRRAIEESADPEHTALDPAGQVLAVAWTGLVVYAVIEAGHAGWADATVLCCLAAGLLCLAAFVAVERRSPRPMLPVALFRRAAFSVVNVASFVLGAASYGGYFLLSLYLQTVRGVSATEAGLWFLPMMSATALASVLTGRLPHRVSLLGGYALCTVALLALPVLDASTSYPVLVVLFVLLGAGMGLALPPTNLAAIGAAPRERSGIASATVNTARQTGTALGIAVLGTVASATADFAAGFVIAGVASAIVTVALATTVRAG